MKRNIQGEKLREWFGKYKLVLLVLAAGVALLLWPGERAEPARSQEAAAEQEFDLEALERKLEGILSRIDGAGEVSVALSVKNGVERVYAADATRTRDGEGWEEQTRTVLVSTGSGTEEVVLVQQRYPAFQGAVVVCAGGGSAEVRLLIAQAVSAITGLGYDKISVCKGNE